MTYRYHHRGVQPILACAFAVIIAASTVWAGGTYPATLIKKQKAGGGKAYGNVRYLAASKEFKIQTKKVTLRIRVSDVARVILKKQPAQLAGAVDAVKRGQFASAIGPLKQIRESYQMFGPDLVAARYLAIAYLGMGKTAEAVRMCEDVLRSNPRAADSGEFAGIYWDALLKEKMHGKLLRILNDSVQRGSREVAAVALVKRGDIYMEKRQTKKALLDGYLRTVLMFRDIKSIQPEALSKAIKAHEVLNEHHHAEKWRKLLLSGYPSSEYAKKLN
jgi:tetratricopeptide (TPR) repeat protein